MERDGIHELSAAYALDALDAEDERRFEEHLARCDECRDHVAAFQGTAALMAYDAPAPSPPAALKNRILAQARAERPNVVAIRERRRWLLPATAGVAAAAAAAALGLGIWGASLSSSLADERAAVDQTQQVVSVLAQPDAKRISLEGANGLLVVDSSGQGWLVVFGLEETPADKTYEAWIVDDGQTRAAGLFHGGDPTVVKLAQRVPAGAAVAVTIEQAGGVVQSKNEPVFASSQTA